MLAESPKGEEKEKEEKVAKNLRYTLLEKLLSFLSPAKEVNAVLAGYFAKVLQALLEKRKLDLLNYIFTFPEHMDNILKHSYCKSISEVLSKILTSEDKFTADMTGDEFVVERQGVLRKMISRMEPSNSIEDITNNCFILCTLLDTKQQLGFFLKEDVLRHIFDIAISAHPMSLRAGLTFFITLNRLRTSPSAPVAEPFNLIGADQPEGTASAILFDLFV